MILVLLRAPLRAFLIACAIFVAFTGWAQTDVLTWHNDSARTGQNLTEALLSPSQVNSRNFGLLANVKVDGKVDAQPLYVSALTIAGLGTHNVLFVATEHDTVFALDADSGNLYWRRSLLVGNEVPSDRRNCGQVIPEIGITATPVIDRSAGPNGTIYLVSMSRNPTGEYFQRIHALDLSNGEEEFQGPVDVKATYPGIGDGSAGGVITFDPKQYKERPAILLVNGTLYTSWGSHCDRRPYGGWVMAYDEKTLAQSSVIEFEPDGYAAAPWNSGAGPAADSDGNVYLSLGNGVFDSNSTALGFPSERDFGNSLVKLSLSGRKLTVVDYWTMFNSKSESLNDYDLGSGGMMLLPDLLDSSKNTKHLAVAAGKDGNLYVADRDHMGHYDSASDGTIYQQITGALANGVWSSPAFYNGQVYYGPLGGALRSYAITGARLEETPVQATNNVFGYPGTTPSISAYGAENGIVWAAENTAAAVLHAYDASDLGREIYSSSAAAGMRDAFGTGNKFIVPTVANGKVYVGTTNSVAIFGFIRQVVPFVMDGDYVLVNENSRLAMDDPHASSATGTPIWQYSQSGALRQRWFISFNGRGYYTIQNASSGLFLSQPNQALDPDKLLEQRIPNFQDNQLWYFTPAGNGFMIRNKSTKLAIGEFNKTTQPGPNLVLGAADGGSDQIWLLH